MSRTLTVLLLVPGLGMVSLFDASAAVCHAQKTVVKDPVTQVVTYKVERVCEAGTTPSARPVVGKGTPSCDLASAPGAVFCVGSLPCFTKDSVVPWVHPATKPPTPDSKYSVRLCFTNIGWQGTAVWDAQPGQPPSLAVQATEAVGHIQLPTATLRFNPTNRTLVNYDTWFWAQGLGLDGQARKGTSALGLVAYATPDRLQVDPGDGSGAVTCQWVTSKSDRCAYRYRRSSLGGAVVGLNGAAAYKATATAFWTLRFELNGVTTAVPGAPLELHRDVASAPVVVVEVQTIVTSAS